MTPEQAVAAAVVIGARLIVPIHYGITPSDDYREVPDAIASLRETARRRGMGVEVVAPGKWVSWTAQNLP
jgi:L-ascorbate metabolism protein UlaG (beta-lactamase superfamily)